MQHELTIGDLDTPIDPAGTLEMSRVSVAVVKAVVKAVSDIIVSAINQITSV